jgi:hypothetical protein
MEAARPAETSVNLYETTPSPSTLVYSHHRKDLTRHLKYDLKITPHPPTPNSNINEPE